MDEKALQDSIKVLQGIPRPIWGEGPAFVLNVGALIIRRRSWGFLSTIIVQYIPPNPILIIKARTLTVPPSHPETPCTESAETQLQTAEPLEPRNSTTKACKPSAPRCTGLVISR